MVCDKTLYLHVGFSKTGTTWLQRNVFPNLSGVDYVEAFDSGLVEISKGAGFNVPFNLSPSFWDFAGEGVVDELLKRPDHENKLLISDENIVLGRGLFRNNNERHQMSYKDPCMLNAHLVKLASYWRKRSEGQLKVIMVVRRQDEWLASRYVQSSKFIKGASQSDFEMQIGRLMNDDVYKFQEGRWLNYWDVYKNIADGVGSENVLVLPYEELKTDCLSFVQKICNFFDCNFDLFKDMPTGRENVRSGSVGDIKYWELRGQGLSFFPKRINKKLEGLKVFNKSISLNKQLSNEILSQFEAQNKLLINNS